MTDRPATLEPETARSRAAHGVTQRIVVFPNRDGKRLFGILHVPEKPAANLAVLLLSPGVKMRVGPHGLYTRMTQMFLELGLVVLRFDFYGLGDSEGTLGETVLRDVYNHIEVGRFVGDAVDAMDWMQQHCGTTRFIVSGLCGGAVTGLLAGSRDARVAGLLALGITPLLASRAADPASYMTTGQLERIKQGYVRKLISPKAWVRLLTFKSDYRVIWKALGLRRNPKPAAEAARPDDQNASPLFPPAFFRLLSTKRPMLLIFGGADRLTWEFDEKFVARHRDTLSTLPPIYDVHVIERANHVLSLEEWQREMRTVSVAWLRRWFASELPAAANRG